MFLLQSRSPELIMYSLHTGVSLGQKIAVPGKLKESKLHLKSVNNLNLNILAGHKLCQLWQHLLMFFWNVHMKICTKGAALLTSFRTCEQPRTHPSPSPAKKLFLNLDFPSRPALLPHWSILSCTLSEWREWSA